MGFRVKLALLVIALHFALMAQAQDNEEPKAEHFHTPAKTGVTIGVMEFVSKGGISQAKVDVLADLLAEEISRMGDVNVVGKSDIISILNIEKQKRLAGCDDKECISDVAGALGVRWMVSGNISRFGEIYVLNLKLFDTEQAQVISRTVRRVRGEEDILLSEITGAAHELFAWVGERIGLPMPGTINIAARHFQPLEQSPSAVTVITREDIEASGANTIVDLLRLVPGMDVVITSPSYSSISTRIDWTFENKNFLVLIDGCEANLELLGYTFFELQPISLDEIQRIEIIRGPGSSLYGANAFVGVISITTRAVPEGTSAWTNITGGEAGLAEFGARVSTSAGPLGLALHAGGLHMGVFTDPDRAGTRQWRLRSTIDYRLSESRRLVLDAGFSSGRGPIATTVGTIHVSVPVLILRTAYESEDLKGQIYWNFFNYDGEIRVPLEFNRTLLAEFADITCIGHTVDGEVQWTPPRLVESLLIITGGGGRVSYLSSDNFLDGETFADIGSPRYHEPGVDHWEGRMGAFVHLEFSPAEWVTVTGGLRFDYNTVTEEFFSPRLAAVFSPTAGQFVRAGVARSFHKPSFMETSLHFMLEFPEESPLTGAGQTEFLEFMTRVVGNNSIQNEEMVSLETGYLGQFLDDRLTLSLDLYCNINRNRIIFLQDIVADPVTGLPDLNRSSFMFENSGVNQYIFGGELSVRYQFSRHLSFLAWWSHREIFQGDQDFGRGNPKNILAAGGRFRTNSGMVGSLYAFVRSELWDIAVENPAGILEPILETHLDDLILLLGKVGWKIHVGHSFDLEAGIKFFLPISFGSPHFRYRERGGGTTLTGKNYGGEELKRLVSGYLQGSF